MKKQYAILSFPHVGRYKFSSLYLCQVRLLHKDKNFPKVYTDYHIEKEVEGTHQSGCNYFDYNRKFTQVGFISIQKYIGKYMVCDGSLGKDTDEYMSKFEGKLINYPLQDKDVHTRLVKTANKYEKELFTRGIKWFYRDRDTDLIFKAENDKEALKIFREKAKTIMFGAVSTVLQDFDIYKSEKTLSLPELVGTLSKLPIYRNKHDDSNQIGTNEEGYVWDLVEQKYTKQKVIYGRYLDIDDSDYEWGHNIANTMTERAIIAIKLNLLNESATKRIYKFIMEKQPDLVGYYINNTFYDKPRSGYINRYTVKLPKDLRTGVQVYPVTMLTYREKVEAKYRESKNSGRFHKEFIYLHTNPIRTELFGKPIKLSQTAIKYYDIENFILDNHIFCASLGKNYFHPNVHVIDFIGKDIKVRYTFGENKEKEMLLVDYLLEQQKLLLKDKHYFDFDLAFAR